MSKLEESSIGLSHRTSVKSGTFSQQESTLRSEVEKALHQYFQHLEDEPATDLYRMVMSEVEGPLLEAVMTQSGNNQSKACIMLGLNRGTLRTKLKNHGLL